MGLGLTDMPMEIYELMELYPQPASHKRPRIHTTIRHPRRATQTT